MCLMYLILKTRWRVTVQGKKIIKILIQWIKPSVRTDDRYLIFVDWFAVEEEREIISFELISWTVLNCLSQKNKESVMIIANNMSSLEQHRMFQMKNALECSFMMKFLDRNLKKKINGVSYFGLNNYSAKKQFLFNLKVNPSPIKLKTK